MNSKLMVAKKTGYPETEIFLQNLNSMKEKKMNSE